MAAEAEATRDARAKVSHFYLSVRVIMMAMMAIMAMMMAMARE